VRRSSGAWLQLMNTSPHATVLLLQSFEMKITSYDISKSLLNDDLQRAGNC
jgi:hypothetical protein